MLAFPKRSNQFNQAFIFIFIISAVTLWYKYSNQKITKIHFPIKSAPYVRPNGCEKRIDQGTNFIQKACLVGNYYMGKGDQYDLPFYMHNRRTPIDFFRLDNNAIAVRCEMLDDNCFIEDVVPNAFVN